VLDTDKILTFRQWNVAEISIFLGELRCAVSRGHGWLYTVRYKVRKLQQYNKHKTAVYLLTPVELAQYTDREVAALGLTCVTVPSLLNLVGQFRTGADPGGRLGQSPP